MRWIGLGLAVVISLVSGTGIGWAQSAPAAEPVVPDQPTTAASSAPSQPTDTATNTFPAATPTPATVVTIAVIGDSMADGFWGGLYRLTHNNRAINLLQLGKNGTGLGHPAKYDWIKAMPEIVAQGKPDIAIIALGINDRGSLILPDGNKAVTFGNDRWKQVYGQRIDAILAPLQMAHIRTFWIGLPVMRDEAANADAKFLNSQIAEAASRNGIAYLPLWDVIGSGDAYAAFGKDQDGRDRQLRQDDGIHYTMSGYDLLAAKLMATLQPAITDIQLRKMKGIVQ